ncbi:hypothetical protein CMQ_4707 [Grosmannia clavigera kw1407]|uniref:Uncharacterized protein n=1 Tax=Grosmannia clavigera (strain kw1407 / UAMH 11150) TaxID=655863 RepID=F0XTI2_GROCL|nr:uncharacterized protein CMQ_4707 [Grosmannia clavigera kw1407]EFW98855.1 hypothetical protein CMQ_4707 [Grosmannia clavigera kw1407]
MATPASDDDVLLPPDDDATAAEFEAFDRFPWSKHRAFLLGLLETLGGADGLSPNPTHQGSTTFCRTVFYRRQTGRRIDLTRYNGFLAASPDYPSIDRRLLAALYAAKRAATTAEAAAALRIVETVAAGPAINPFDGTATPHDDAVPSWQRSAPKNELRVPRAAAAADEAAGASAANGEAPYSDKFAKVIEAVQTGKELEGIRHIPDTVVRQEGITPLGKLKPPKKPWETAAAPTASLASALAFGAPITTESGHSLLVDLHFPPPPEQSGPVQSEVGQ